MSIFFIAFSDGDSYEQTVYTIELIDTYKNFMGFIRTMDKLREQLLHHQNVLQ